MSVATVARGKNLKLQEEETLKNNQTLKGNHPHLDDTG